MRAFAVVAAFLVTLAACTEAGTARPAPTSPPPARARDGSPPSRPFASPPLGGPRAPVATPTPATLATPIATPTPFAAPPLAPVAAPPAAPVATATPAPVVLSPAPTPVVRAISGKVRDGSGAALAGAPVVALLGGSAACCTVVASALTDSVGAYALRVAPGTYRVRFLPPAGSALTARWWKDGSDFAGATDVTVGDAGAQNVDGVLGAVSFVVSGAVTSILGGGIEGVTVAVFPGGPGAPCASCKSVASAKTDANGGYALALPTGTYRIQFAPPAGYAAEWWKAAADFASAADLTVGSANLANVSAALKPTYAVSGTITSASSGTPIAGVVVTAYPGGSGATCNGCAAVASAVSDAQGTYALTLARGVYRIHFAPPGPYAARWWSAGTDFAHATDLSVIGSVTISPSL